jgi:hypothetical protein
MLDMKNAKRVLLGTAAGFASVAAAQAADLPVKARPVQYVRICSLYGDGYYYIPGSDTCIKIGGRVSMEAGYNYIAGQDPALGYTGTGGAQDRTVSPISTRAKANVYMDTRSETQYGTLRTYTSVQFQNQNQSESFNAQRAFIQWAGFTVGRVNTFTTTWILDDAWSIIKAQTGHDSGSSGLNEAAYTFDLGSGVALNLGVSERATKSLTNLSVNSALKVGAEPTDFHGGESYPDPWINLREDASWGFVSATLEGHNVNATDYTQSGTSPSLATSGVPGYTCTAAGFAGGVGAANTPLSSCGHPSDRIGWVATVGGELRIPMPGDLTDRIGAGVRYGNGADQLVDSSSASPDRFGAGNVLALGWTSDGVFVNGSGIQLTTAWGGSAGYEHAWTGTFRTTLVAGYTNVSYNSTALGYFSDAIGCTATGSGAARQTSVSISSGTNCNPGFQFLESGIGTSWTPVPDLSVRAQLSYYQVWTGFKGDLLNLSNAGANPIIGARPAGIYSTNNSGFFAFAFQVSRGFNGSSN